MVNNSELVLTVKRNRDTKNSNNFCRKQLFCGIYLKGKDMTENRTKVKKVDNVNIIPIMLTL